MSNPFKLILLSAWHEQGGNVLHRHLDGHPSLFVYPFESQLATPYSSNLLTPTVPQRYAWPEFTTEMSSEQAYQAMWDEELKTYLRTPWRSKFKDCGIEMDEKTRIDAFKKISSPLVYGDNGSPFRFPRSVFVEAFFRSTFEAWINRENSGRETHYVGYSPPIAIDADKIFKDFPDAQIVHVVRNPWSGFADTIKRPFPYSLEKYCQIWSMVQLSVLTSKAKYGNRFHMVRYEDLVLYPKQIMDVLCLSLGLPTNDKTYYPSFNGKKLESVRPWGTIISATSEANLATANELSTEQKAAIATECGVMNSAFGYSNFLDNGTVPIVKL